VRVSTLLNRMIGLPGLWVKGVRWEGETLIVEIEAATRPRSGVGALVGSFLR